MYFTHTAHLNPDKPYPSMATGGYWPLGYLEAYNVGKLEEVPILSNPLLVQSDARTQNWSSPLPWGLWPRIFQAEFP